MIRSNKYKRLLSEYEARRYEGLVFLYKKLYGEHYDGRIVNHKSNETLADIACSKRRHSDVSKYYTEELKKKRLQAQKEVDQEKEEWIKVIEHAMHKIENELGIEIIEIGCDEDCDCHKTKEATQDSSELSSDMLAASKIYVEAFDLMKSRNTKYGDSWKVLSIQSLANLCEMKLHRIANLDKVEPKIYDELIDTLNYMVFGLLKLKSQNQGKNNNE